MERQALTNFRRWRWRHSIGLALLTHAAWAQQPSGAPAAPEAASRPSPREAAATAFERGKEFLRIGKVDEALVEFERAYSVLPAYQVLYYLGDANFRLGRWAKAREALERYLDLGASKLSPAQIAEVRKNLELLTQRTASLSLSSNVAGADVQVDGARLEPTKLSGLILDGGDHLIRVSKPGFQPLEQAIRATEGQTLHLVVQLMPQGEVAPDVIVLPGRATAGPALGEPLESAAQPMPVPTASAAARPPADEDRMARWVPWAITGTLAAGWVTAAALAIKARHDRDTIERPGVSSESIDDARKVHLALAVVSDVLLASTLASAGVSAYLTWWDAPADQTSEHRDLQQREAGFSVGVFCDF